MHADVPTMEAVFPPPEGPLVRDDDSSPSAPPEPNEHEPSARMSDDAAEAPARPSWWTAALLAQHPDFSVSAEARRFGIGVGLSALYGLSLGARAGGKAFFAHAVGVPSALCAVAALGVPALYIVLALFDVPIEHPRVIAAASRSAARTGLVLAGLAPAAALFVITSEHRATAAVAALVGLFMAGAIGMGGLLGELRHALVRARAGARAGADFAFMGFGLFATLLAARVWWSMLPLLGGQMGGQGGGQ